MGYCRWYARLSSRCISKIYLCDGLAQCSNQADELKCREYFSIFVFKNTLLFFSTANLSSWTIPVPRQQKVPSTRWSLRRSSRLCRLFRWDLLSTSDEELARTVRTEYFFAEQTQRQRQLPLITRSLTSFLFSQVSFTFGGSHEVPVFLYLLFLLYKFLVISVYLWLCPSVGTKFFDSRKCGLLSVRPDVSAWFFFWFQQRISWKARYSRLNGAEIGVSRNWFEMWRKELRSLSGSQNLNAQKMICEFRTIFI